VYLQNSLSPKAKLFLDLTWRRGLTSYLVVWCNYGQTTEADRPDEKATAGLVSDRVSGSAA